MRPLAPHEVDLHRDLRLRALGDAPASFGETLADAAVQPQAYWEELTRCVTRPGADVMFLACEGETILGCVYGMLDRQRKNAGRIGGTWVQTEHRHRGIGSALVREVFAWSRERGLTDLGLWAPAHESAAIALYRRAGFQATGERRPLPGQPAFSIVAMEAQVDEHAALYRRR